MTRLAVLADIHGNLPALEAVGADMAAFDVDHVVVAGDAIHWGPFSGGVVQRIVDEGWAVIRGNHEFYLLDHGTPRAPAAWGDRSQWGALDWLREQLSPRQRTLVAAWPDTLRLCFPDAPPVRVVHGSPRDNRDGLYPTDDDASMAARLAGVEEATVIAAHTHLALERRPGRWHLLNPGSVGVPFDCRHEASYLILDGAADGWRPTFRRVPFDPAPILAEFARQRAAERWGALGPLLVEEFRTARMHIGAFLRWLATHHPGARLTPELVAEFGRVDAWRYIPADYHLARAAASGPIVPARRASAPWASLVSDTSGRGGRPRPVVHAADPEADVYDLLAVAATAPARAIAPVLTRTQLGRRQSPRAASAHRPGRRRSTICLGGAEPGAAGGARSRCASSCKTMSSISGRDKAVPTMLYYLSTIANINGGNSSCTPRRHLHHSIVGPGHNRSHRRAATRSYSS